MFRSSMRFFLLGMFLVLVYQAMVKMPEPSLVLVLGQ